MDAEQYEKIVEKLEDDLELSKSELKVCKKDLERLEAERDNAKRAAAQKEDERASWKEWCEAAEAQLAEMRAALTVVRDEETLTIDALDMVEKALTTDGKAAADVLAAAVEMDDGKYHVTDRFINAVRAYRKEGRDDG